MTQDPGDDAVEPVDPHDDEDATRTRPALVRALDPGNPAERPEGSDDELPDAQPGATTGEPVGSEGGPERTLEPPTGDPLAEPVQTRGLFDIDDPSQRLATDSASAATSTEDAASAVVRTTRRRRNRPGRDITPEAGIPAAPGRFTSSPIPPPARAAILVLGTIVVGAGAAMLLRGTSGLPGNNRSDIISRNSWVYVYIAVLGAVVAGAIVLLLSANRSKRRGRARPRRVMAGSILAVVAVAGLVGRSEAEDRLQWDDDTSTVNLSGDQERQLDGTSVPTGEKWVGAYHVLEKSEYTRAAADQYVQEQRDAGISYAALIDGSRDSALDDDPVGTLDRDQYLIVFGWSDRREGVEPYCPLLSKFPVEQELCEARHVVVR